MLVEASKVSHGEVTEEVMLANLLIGAWTLICVIDDEADNKIIAAATCDLTTFASGKKVLLVGSLGGERMDEWLTDLHDHITEFSKLLDISAIYINGRPGWEKVLKKHGFEKIYSTFVRSQTWADH
jgi:hypothetical protein